MPINVNIVGVVVLILVLVFTIRFAQSSGKAWPCSQGQGFINDRHSSMHTENRQQCQQACSNDPECVAIDWANNCSSDICFDNNCQMYTSNMIDTTRPNPDNRCFSIKPVTIQNNDNVDSQIVEDGSTKTDIADTLAKQNADINSTTTSLASNGGLVASEATMYGPGWEMFYKPL